MGRLARRNLGNGVYHVYNRCANNMWILDTDEDKNKFLNLLVKYKEKYHFSIYHYCIMSNHFHLAIEGDIKDISSFISEFVLVIAYIGMELIKMVMAQYGKADTKALQFKNQNILADWVAT